MKLRDASKNIDETQALAKALLISEERFRLFSVAMSDGLLVHDGGIVTFANEVLEQLLGYQAGGLLGVNVKELVAPEVREQVLANAAAQTERPYEIIGLRKDDTRFPARLTTRTMRLGERPLRVVVVRDLTEQRRLEDSLRRSEERLQQIINGAPEAIAVHSDGKFVYVNAAAVAMSGYACAEELIGRSALAIIHPEDRLLAAQRIKEGQEKGHPAPMLEERIVRADGTVVMAEVSTVPIELDSGPAIVTFAYDITARKLAEKKLDELLTQEKAAHEVADRAGQRAEFLAEASRMLAGSLGHQAGFASVASLAVPKFADWCAFDVLDRDGHIRRVAAAHVDPLRENEIWQCGLLLSRDASGNRMLEVIRTGRSYLAPVFDQDALRAMGHSSPGLEYVEAIARLNPTSVMIMPMIARGKVLGAITMVMSSSGRRYSPEDMVLAEDLAQRSALAFDNAWLYLESQEAVLAREEFLSIASHELKTPLTSLQLAVQSLARLPRREVAESLDVPMAFFDQAIETAKRQSHRLIHLVNALLDVSQIQAGRLSLSPEVFELSALVQEVADRQRVDLERAGCKLELNLQPAWGRWDRSRVDQVITNLLSNAVKFGPGAPIVVGVDITDRTARISVRDHGIGIAQEEQERIFKRFERAVSHRHYGGLGLGLYIVHCIVEAHGGTIRVESQPGKGAEFIVEIPKIPPEDQTSNSQNNGLK